MLDVVVMVKSNINEINILCQGAIGDNIVKEFPCLKTMKNQFVVCSVDDRTVSYRRRLPFTSRREEKGRLALVH